MNLTENSKQLATLIEWTLLVLGRLIHLGQKWQALHRQPATSYENLSLKLTLRLVDSIGRRAIVTREQRVRFLTSEAGVIQSPIWGQGELTRRYAVQGARKLGARHAGGTEVLLLGLDREPGRHSQASINATRTILNGFLGHDEHFEVVVQRPTRRLSVRVVYPKARRPKHALVTSTPREVEKRLAVRLDQKGRPWIGWSITNPTVRTLYSLRWSW